MNVGGFTAKVAVIGQNAGGKTNIKPTKGVWGWDEAMNLSELFTVVCELAIKDGAAPLKEKFPGKCWEKQLNEQWFIAVNGNDAEVKCSKGVTVPPFHAYGERDGCPTFLCNPYGGTTGHIGSYEHDDESEAIEVIKRFLNTGKG